MKCHTRPRFFVSRVDRYGPISAPQNQKSGSGMALKIYVRLGFDRKPMQLSVLSTYSGNVQNPRARTHDGHAGPPPGLKMRARPQQTGQSRRSGPLLNALIGAGTHARALAAVERA